MFVNKNIWTNLKFDDRVMAHIYKMANKTNNDPNWVQIKKKRAACIERRYGLTKYTNKNDGINNASYNKNNKKRLLTQVKRRITNIRILHITRKLIFFQNNLVSSARKDNNPTKKANIHNINPKKSNERLNPSSNDSLGKKLIKLESIKLYLSQFNWKLA